MISSNKIEDISFYIQNVILEIRKRYGINIHHFKGGNESANSTLKRVLANIGFSHIGSGGGRMVFASPKYPRIAIKVTIYNREQNEKEISVFEEIKKIKNRYHKKKFLRIHSFSKQKDVIVCERLFSVKWDRIKCENPISYFEKMLKKSGLTTLNEDLHRENLMMRCSNTTRASDMVLCDLGGYCGRIRKIRRRK